MPTRLTAANMFTGLFAALALKERTEWSLSGKSFDRALVKVFAKAVALSEEEQLDLRFRIKLHPLHGDSELVRSNIFTSTQRGLISLDNPDYKDIRLKIKISNAEKKIESVPGTKEFYLLLADELIDAYRPEAA